MAAISRAVAVDVVREQAAADQSPALSDFDVGGLVDRSAREDAAGNAVSSADWAPTYDLNAATALAWERKAALTASSKFDVNIDRQQLSRSQVYDHCVAEAKRYRARTAGTMRRTAPENHLPYGSGYDVAAKS